ncbi:MAG: hypothetical protein JRF42_15005 [Deltaproteobacteria bacterium]|nr:hypothetical protein [Deltaproteobacteria bacterium]
MRWVVCACIVIALGACKEDLYFIPGTGTLPECDEAPSSELDGTLWFDQGEPNATFMSCALNWAFTQEGNDLSIVVDEEYRLEGRLCGDQLHLRGGWWLPVVDEDVGYCTYEDDSADEVGIMAEGNVLTYVPSDGETPAQMTGMLVVQGSCRAEYEVMFSPVNVPSPN